MSKPYIHSLHSAKAFGGKWEDYIEIHDFMDSSKVSIGDNRHRALTHHTFFVHQVLTRVFGHVIINSDGKAVSVKDVGEQHLMDDMGFLPSAQDYIQDLPLKHWHSKRAGELPSSQAEIVKSRKVTVYAEDKP